MTCTQIPIYPRLQWEREITSLYSTGHVIGPHSPVRLQVTDIARRHILGKHLTHSLQRLTLRNVYVTHACHRPIKCHVLRNTHGSCEHPRACGTVITPNLSPDPFGGATPPGITLFVVSLPRNYVEAHALHSVQLTYDSDVPLEPPPYVVQPIGQALTPQVVPPAVTRFFVVVQERDSLAARAPWATSIRNGHPSRYNTRTMRVLFRWVPNISFEQCADRNLSRHEPVALAPLH
jgi:hypothetical protein